MVNLLIMALFLLLPREAGAEETVTYGVYQSHRGESLKAIAGKKEIYGDPEKWSLLYILNREELKSLNLKLDKIPESPLPEGTLLTYVKAAEARKKGAALLKERKIWWTVNVASVMNLQEIYFPAVVLMDRGFFVYTMEWLHRKKSWKRLRVGFFKDQGEATEKGKEAAIILGLKEFWTVEAEWKEKNEYLGFASLLSGP